HTAAAQQAGMTAAMFAELMAVVGMANTTNRLANGYQVDIDDRFRTPAPVVGNHGEPSVAAGVFRRPPFPTAATRSVSWGSNERARGRAGPRCRLREACHRVWRHTSSGGSGHAQAA